MRTKIFNKISTYVLMFLALILFGTSPVFMQTPGVNGKIAFVSDRDGNSEIYSINPNGSGMRRLTFNPGVDDYPAWSPDGAKIAYLSGQSTIKIMNADGSEPRIVTQIDLNLTTANFCGERFALDWSPDGSKIVFQEFGNIVTVNIDGTNRQNVTTSPLRESEPSWGLTGPIAYASTLTGGDNTNGLDIRTTNGGLFALYGYYTCSTSPDLSSNGTKLAYVHSYDFPPPGFITILDPNPPYDRTFNFYNVVKVRWSPDGNLLVFGTVTYTNPGFRSEIEIFNEFGQGRRFLTEGRNPAWGTSAARRVSNYDFDGDGRSDLAVFRPSDGTWYLNQSTAGFSAAQFGLSTDKIAPADFDGDGKTDIAVFRDGAWYWLNSSNNSFNAAQFGLANDTPVPADFTGDGRAELAVYRGGIWYSFNLSNNQSNAVQFGLSTDKPVMADYDGDSRADYAVYRDGVWYLLRSTQGFAAIHFGLPTDKLVPADYDGDGKTDQAVYRSGTWYLLRSSQGFTAFQFGLPTDIPAPADYDGDGRTDVAVFRSSNWYVIQSSNGNFSYQQFGSSGDIPVAANTQ